VSGLRTGLGWRYWLAFSDRGEDFSDRAHGTATTERMELNCYSAVKFSTVVLKSLWKTNNETPQRSVMTWLNTLCTIEVQTEISSEYFRNRK
jgi:hypothetical protein